MAPPRRPESLGDLDANTPAKSFLGLLSSKTWKWTIIPDIPKKDYLEFLATE